MNLDDANKYLGGSFEFMGVAVRADEFDRRKTEMTALSGALADALRALRTMSGDELIGALPKAMTTGLDTKEFGEILVRHRDALYPETTAIDLPSARRVAQSLAVGGLIKPETDIGGLHDTSIAGG
jgi:NitT/TauT family transport system substrate-binding protein